MHVAHNGYTDPNSLKFENITVMGVSATPASVLVSDGITTDALSESQVHYDSTKKVVIVLKSFLFTTKVNMKLCLWPILLILVEMGYLTSYRNRYNAHWDHEYKVNGVHFYLMFTLTSLWRMLLHLQILLYYKSKIKANRQINWQKLQGLLV